MKIKTPKAITHGHANLCEELNKIIENYSHIEKQTRTLNEIMTKHFNKEERYALPPLGLLLTLSEGNWELGEDAVIEMTNDLDSHLGELKKEHENISENMLDLKAIAEKENYSDLKRFINDLEIHMELEDQVLYPASILIGNYFHKLKRND